MRSPSKAPHAVSASSKTATARLPSTRPPQVGASAVANDDADAAPHEPDPLWMIVIAMAVFFGIAAVLLIAD